MERIIINTKEATIESIVESLGHLYFGWCNVINTKMLESLSRQANLEVYYPNDNKAFEYHYFFDIRDCNDSAYRPSGKTDAEMLQYIEKELCDLRSRLKGVLRNMEYNDAIGEEKYLKMEEKIDSLYSRLEKVGDEVYALSETIGQ